MYDQWSQPPSAYLHLPSYLPVYHLLVYIPVYTSASLSTFSPSCPPSYLPDFLPSCLSVLLPSLLPVHIDSYLPVYFHSHLPTCLPTCLPSCLSASHPLLRPASLRPVDSRTTNHRDNNSLKVSHVRFSRICVCSSFSPTNNPSWIHIGDPVKCPGINLRWCHFPNDIDFFSLYSTSTTGMKVEI